MRLILSGAAPLASHVEAYLRVVTCAHVLQGYGMRTHVQLFSCTLLSCLFLV